MTPLRAIACLAAAGLGIWLLLLLGGFGGEAAVDPYAAEADPAPTLGESMAAEVALEGSADEGRLEETPIVEGTFRFTVRHAHDERVLEGVRIDDLETGYVGTSNAQGELELTRPVERFPFEATARGYLLSRGTARGGTETVIFMTPGVPVRGVVLDRETRASVAGASIRTWDDDAGRFATGTVTSDENGRFELLGVRLNHPFTVLAKVEGLVPVRSTHTLFNEGEDIEVLVGGSGRIVGTVRGLEADPDGEGEESIYVYLSPPGERLPEDLRPHDPWQGPAPASKQELEARAWMTFRTVTGEEGGYEIRGVPLDTPLQVVARVSAREQLRSNPLVLTTKAPEATVDLTLGKRASLRIFFLDENGGPMPRPRFELRGPFSDFLLQRPASKGPRGSVTFDDIPVGRWQLVASVPDGPRHTLEVELDPEHTQEVTILSVSGETLSGTVRGPDGEPVPGAKVRWAPGNIRWPVVEVTADQRGVYFMRGLLGRCSMLEGLPPPSYDAQARYERVDMGRVLAGQQGFTVRLEGKPAFEGTVFGPRRIRRVQVDVRTHRYQKTLWFPIGEDGRFVLPGLPEPQGLIEFRAKDLAPTFVVYRSYAEADDLVARVWLEEPRKVLVTAHAAKGGPVAGARIRAVDARLPYVWRTDAQGEAELAGLPPGPTDVVADSAWHTPRTFSVQAALAGKRNHLDMGPALGVVEGYVIWPERRRTHVVAFMQQSVREYARNKRQPPKAQPNAAGWFSKRLPAGQYEVWLFRTDRWPRFRLGRVKVEAGKRVRFAGD